MAVNILLRNRSLGRTYSKGHATGHKTTRVNEIRRQIILGKIILMLLLATATFVAQISYTFIWL